MSTSPLTMVLNHLEGVRKSGSSFVARCPGHPDKNPSLSIDEGDDGRVLLCCHAGCDTATILAGAKLQVSDLFPATSTATNGNNPDEIIATYPYVDEKGNLLFEVIREAGKKFVQRRPDGYGGWEWTTKGTRRVLFGLPDVIDAVKAGVAVYVVEGEKDALAIGRAGGVATCNPGGAGKWAPEYAEVLRGADVVIVADQDGPGIAHAATVEASLVNVARSVRVVAPAVGKDAYDHLEAGYGMGDFEEDAAKKAAPNFFLDWGEFWAKDRRDAEWIYEDVLAKGRGHSLFAGHKVGKSLLMLFLAAKVVADGSVVIYLDYEMGEDDLYDRLADMGYGPETDFARLRYALLPSLPPLDEAVGAKALLEIVDEQAARWPGRHLVVVIDTTGRAVAGEENSADTYRNFYRWTGLGLKQRGATWARLDHAGKDAAKGQRGSSAKGDDVDVVWQLSRSDGGLVLKRTAARMGWVPEQVTFRQENDPHLRFVKVVADWPAGTRELVDALDKLGVGLEAGERPAGKAVREAGHTCTQAVLRAALKFRRNVAESGYR